MVNDIEKDKGKNGILVWDIDRLTRNPVDSGTIRWLLQQGIIYCVKTPIREYYPQDAGLLMALEEGRACDFLIRHSRNVKRGMEHSVINGRWPGNVPIGYKYHHKKKNIVPIKNKAEIALKIFEKYSTGRYGIRWVSRTLEEFGIVNKYGRRWSNSRVQTFLSNKLYIGVMTWNGVSYKGKYETFISTELFNKVQKVLKKKSKPRRVRKGHNFAFCGIFRCSCGSMITAQWARGNGGLYCYYRCADKTGTCKEKYLQDHLLVGQCIEALKPLAITEQESSSIREAINDIVENDNKSIEETTKGIKKELISIQDKLDNLTDKYIDEVVDEDSYKSATARLVAKKARLSEEKRRLLKEQSFYWIEPAFDYINSLESIAKLDSKSSKEEIAKLVQEVGLNHKISDKKISFALGELSDYTASFLALKRKESAGNPCSHNEKSSQCSSWWALQGSNLRPTGCKPVALAN